MIAIELTIGLSEEPGTVEALGEAKALLEDIEKLVKEFGESAALYLREVRFAA